jgi:hypothetical protein
MKLTRLNTGSDDYDRTISRPSALCQQEDLGSNATYRRAITFFNVQTFGKSIAMQIRLPPWMDDHHLPSCHGALVNCDDNRGAGGAVLEEPIQRKAETALPPPTAYRRAKELKSNAVRCMLKQRSAGAHVLSAPLKRRSSETINCSTTSALSAGEWRLVFEKCCTSKKPE